jgi:Domain of unknown function (DUF6485)
VSDIDRDLASGQAPPSVRFFYQGDSFFPVKAVMPMECQIEVNKKRCNCTYDPCSRKGICCECVAYHRAQDQLPACYFSKDIERTYDRSVEKFLSFHLQKKR